MRTMIIPMQMNGRGGFATTDDPARPQYASTLTWNTAPSLKDSTFTFTPPKDAARIELVEVDAVAVEEDSP